MTKLTQMLIKHEGVKLKPYRCTEGFLTIGVGRNLDAVGISEDEAMLLLANDIAKCEHQAQGLPWFKDLGEPRQTVILSMIFNLGLSKFLTFTRLTSALSQRDYDKASNEMLSSHWSSQVGKRALELAQIMKSGSFQL